MSLWRRSQYDKHRSDTRNGEESTSVNNKNIKIRHHPKRLLRIVVILFVVGIQLQLFQTLTNHHKDDFAITGNQDTSSSSVVTPSYLPSRSDVTTSIHNKNDHDDPPSSSSPSRSRISEQSWNEWETKFQHTSLFEELQKSSLYGTITNDALIMDNNTCDNDYWRDYAQVTKPARADDITMQLPTSAGNTCDWPERIRLFQYPWNQWRQFSSSSSSCPLVHFSPTQACQVLQERSSSTTTKSNNKRPMILLFLGDSLIRQIVVGLGIVLSGNHISGGLQYIHPHPTEDYSEVWKHVCSCENQYGCATLKQEEEMGRFTHVFGYNPDTYQNHVDVCSNTATTTSKEPSYQIIFEQENNNPKISPMLRHLMKSHPNHQFVIVTDASALHAGLNIRKTRRFLDKLEALFLSNNNNNASSSCLIIPMTVHWVGVNKPIEYQPNQGRQAVEDYNQLLRKMVNAKQNNYKLLDTYNLTRGMPSQDGTHYPMASVALAQMVILYIREYVPIIIPT